MPKLYVVATPIGNLNDLSPRMREALEMCDLIAAEDTRVTMKLTKVLGLHKPMVSCHRHNESQKKDAIIEKMLAEDLTVALTCDAGTPGISDPGYLLVKHCISNDIEVECLPGATAFVPALINSGFASDRFCFEGFLPQKKGRQKRIEALRDEDRTMIFYESPYRLIKALEQFGGVFGNERMVCVSREISKLHEENFRGSITEAIAHFTETGVKGEIVIVVEGAKNADRMHDDNDF